MQKTSYSLITVLLALLFIGGCAGPLRYAQVSPEATAFHPDSIVVLAVTADGYPDAQGQGDVILAKALAKKHKWFKRVVHPSELTTMMMKSPSLKKDVADYVEKLQTVSFSDPDLSKRIGEAVGVQALMVGRVDLWHYVEEGEKKQAKVGLELKLIEAATGTVVWRANHNRILDYMLLRPGLSGMAEDLSDDMVDQMPH